MSAPIEVLCWSGDFELPSVDPLCLAVLAHTKFSGASVDGGGGVRLREAYKSWCWPTANLPVVKTHQGRALRSRRAIASYLKTQGFDPDSQLSEKDKLEIEAYLALLENKLLPALMQVWWVDSKNYTEFTRKCYASRLPFPFSLFLPDRLRETACLKVSSSHSKNNKSENREIVYKSAKECFNILSTRLGEENDFFFGDTPSSLDAVVFGYLVSLLKAPLPSNPLQGHLQACDNLCRFCSRILQKYFPAQPTDDYEYTKKEEPVDLSPEYADPHRVRNTVLSVAVAAVAMVLHALAIGIISVEYTTTDKEEEDNELDQDVEQRQS